MDDHDASASVRFALLLPRGVRLDVAPFAIGYMVGFIVYFTSPANQFAANVATPMVAALHLLTFLMSHWSMSVRCALQFRGVRCAKTASHVRAQPDSGRPELCELQQGTGPGGQVELHFEYRKRIFIFDAPYPDGAPSCSDDAAHFVELAMPVEKPLAHYVANSRGLKIEALADLQLRYGHNSFDIPMRTFRELLAEQAVAPFFVFQVRTLCAEFVPLAVQTCVNARIPHPPGLLRIALVT